jgi:uncharacterized protein DUF4115
MPETRVERAVFVLGLVAIGALALLVVYYWHKSHVAAAPTPTTTTVALSAQQPRVKTAPASRSATTAPATTTRPGTATTATTLAPTTTAAPITPGRATSLVLTASRDTWLEVRSGSSTGTLLYSGILASGASKTFRGVAIWTRFGSGGNLAARVDGRPLSLPPGTYNALFDSSGFQQVRG